MQKVTGQYAPEYGDISYPWYALRDIQRVAYGSWGWSCPHEDVRNAMELARPHDLHKLALEVPVPANDDAGGKSRVLYYRTREDYNRSKRTETSVGKYLRRHWGNILPDHYFRDCAMQYSTTGCRVLTDLDEMVHAVRHGPHSCMSYAHVGEYRHPYRAYLPELGWSLLVKEVPGAHNAVLPDVTMRALVLTRPDGTRCMVRAYGVWEAAHAWAVQNNVEILDGWPAGTELAYNPALVGAPYVDGLAAASLIDDRWHLLGEDFDPEEHDEHYDLQNSDTTCHLYGE